ncbi:MAG: 50S ribosomal protein L24 [Clostridiales bacterium]|jgi:large subunit ribosomal protein L24|nr:50S ribosomal protein L24 [Clostridiales bacterium]
MGKLHVKTGDTVLVLSGKDRGAKGKVLKVMPDESKVLVEGVAKVTKHKKPKNRQDQGGLVTKESPIDSSNVMVICTKCGKPTRVGNKLVVNGDKKTKVRICKKCGANIKTVDTSK